MKRRKIALLLAGLMAASMLAGCSSDAGNGNSGSGSSGSGSSGSGDSGNGDSGSEAITVITREDGSGTRGAFVELTGVEADGEDQTTEEAVVANQTEAVITQVSGDPAAIGYISLGSLNDTVKALKVEGVEATPENVKNGTYTVARPFYIATKGEATGVAADFISFIMSKQGQEIVSDGYIAVNDAAADFAGTQPEGKIVVAGSSSVTPVMEKLQEAYLELNPNATIEIQQTDSSAGMTAAIDGTCDIGMASRELKDSELESLTPTVIAQDGIAVIVNNESGVTDLTSEQVKAIYTGEITTWEELQ